MCKYNILNFKWTFWNKEYVGKCNVVSNQSGCFSVLSHATVSPSKAWKRGSIALYINMLVTVLIVTPVVSSMGFPYLYMIQKYPVMVTLFNVFWRISYFKNKWISEWTNKKIVAVIGNTYPHSQSLQRTHSCVTAWEFPKDSMEYTKYRREDQKHAQIVGHHTSGKQKRW